MEMTAALDLAKVGKSTWLGLGTSSTAGVDYLHDALRRYPREDFAADFFQKPGDVFYEREDYERASEEFNRVPRIVRRQRRGGPPRSYMIGRTAGARHERMSSFDTVDYDVRPLKDARRHYERFLEEADRMRRLARARQEMGRRHPEPR